MSHCGFLSHTIDKCFQLIGYPSGWKDQKGPRSAPNSAAAHALISSSEEYPTQENSESAATLFLPKMIAQFLAYAKNQ